MATLNPYLNFNGNAEEAFNFYKSVFGGEFTNVQRFKDTPEGSKLSASEKNKIMHIGLPIGKGNVLMATDALESMGHKVIPGNQFQLSITAESEEEGNRVFKALAKGGKTLMPLEKASWGGYFGMLHDKFGVQWMVNHSYPKTESKKKEKELSHQSF